MRSIHEPVRVHKALDAQVNIGPIPGSQIWWWGAAMMITIVICTLFNKGWPVGFPLFVWMAATSWILTGKDSWRFLNRFHKPQHYTFAGLAYEPFVGFRNNADKDKNQKAQNANRQRL